MLIINNGYGKSGTTWIQRGLRYYFNFHKFDDVYQNPGLANPSIAAERILSFASDVNTKNTHYYSKSHWPANHEIEGGRLAQALLRLPNVVVINSIRNIGDSTVSWYHHRKRQDETRDFEPWFWDEGVGFVHRYMTHHMSWAHTQTPPFLFSFEAMKINPYAAFAAFRDRIGLDDARPESDFNHHMDFDVTKAESKSQHMRKGLVGDRVNYLSGEMVAHIETQFEKRRFFEKCRAYFDAHGIDPSSLALSGAGPVA